SWMRLAAAIAGVLVLVLAIIFAFNLGRGSILPEEEDQTGSPSPSASEGQQAPQPVDVVAVSDLDPPPEGNGEENPATVGNVIDGSTETTWRTLTYDRSAQFGNLKSGLGLVLDLGEPTEVNRVDLALVGSPTSLELYAAGDQAPTSIDGLEQVGASDGTGEQVRVSLDEPARTRYLVVWLTSVPPVGGAQFRGEVAEIVVRS
ncbi:MAG: discoidin domain-containing protein, partial [Nocardioides sp.]